MPARVHIGRRAAMERWLSEGDIEALAAACRAARVALARWPTVAGIARPFELIAWSRATESLVEAGRGRRDAEEAAARALGLSRDTLASRAARWGEQAIRRPDRRAA